MKSYQKLYIPINFLILIYMNRLHAGVQMRAVKVLEEVCIGQDINLSFPFSTDEEIVLINWYKINTNKTNEKITIAQYRDHQFKPKGNYKGRVDLIRATWGIKLKNINLNDEGRYECDVEVENSNDHASLFLDVLEPPSQLPRMNLQQQEEDTRIECQLNPSDAGNPPVDIHIEDEYGRVQSHTRLVISKGGYKCCITGKAARCYNNSKSYKQCTEIEYGTGCQQHVPGKCFRNAVLFCLGFCTIVFLGWTAVIMFVKKRHYIAFIKKKRIPTPVRTAFCIWIGSQVANLFIALTFCLNVEGCYDVSKTLWIGLGACFASTMAASHMTIAYYIADSWNKRKKTDGDNLHSEDTDENVHCSQSSGETDESAQPFRRIHGSSTSEDSMHS